MAEKCCAELQDVMGTCLRSATVRVGGKGYCWQHDPSEAERKARERREAREAHMAKAEARWKRIDARRELIELVRLADDTGGKTHIKPAGQKVELCFCVPVDLWMQVRDALERMGDDPE